MYTMENNAVNPVENTRDTSMEQRVLILPALSASSPGLYFWKKSAERDKIRIITAACTCIPILVPIRCISIVLTVSTSRELTLKHTIKKVMDQNRRILPLSVTCEKIIWFIFGESIPSAVSPSAAARNIPTSKADNVSHI